MSRDASEEDIGIFLEQAQKETSPDERMNIDSILQVSVSANRRTFDNLKRRNLDMCEALKSLMKDEIEIEVEKGKIETLLELVAEGLLSVKDAAKKLGMSEEDFYKRYPNI